MKINLVNESSTEDNNVLCILANHWGLKQDDNALMSLVVTQNHLELRKRDEPNLGGIWVDFINGTLAYRRRFGGGRSEAVAKAIGIKGNYFPNILDATAGLGHDAFILAAIGCQVQMLERHPVVALLLADGLYRGYQDAEIGGWLQDRLTLIHASSLTILKSTTIIPDVVYLDPMYPNARKRALVKKKMRILKSLVGEDTDADDMLLPARYLAKKRVVVKRSSCLPPLAGIANQSVLVTKKHRFDIYLPLAK